MGSLATVADEAATSRRHDIPSLDGLRAFSIGLVILAHTKVLLPAALVHSGTFRYVVGGGLHGVQVFFVISGFLITTLLLREVGRSGDISFRRFYARRTLRIFPPFYLYLATVAALWLAHIAPGHWPTFAAAATYTFVYFPHPQGWLVEHSWSMSIEEQFYLLWPMLLLFAYRRGRAMHLALATMTVMPIIRGILLFVEVHQMVDFNRLLVQTSAIDTLMVGCLLALLRDHGGWQTWQRRFLNAASATGLFMIGFVLVPYATAKLAVSPTSLVANALGPSITALSIGGLLIYAVNDEHGIAGKILKLRGVRHVGVISYSLYLWQQLFTEDPARFGGLTYLLMLAAAELSFWLVERPLMRVRARLA